MPVKWIESPTKKIELKDLELKGRFDSVINLRPSEGNDSRGVEDPLLREKIREIVNRLIT